MSRGGNPPRDGTRRRSSRGYLVRHLLRRLFQKRETIAFPNGPLTLHPNYRGQVRVDAERCAGCGRCARDCPTQGLVVERTTEGGVHIIIYHDRCASCGLCALSCPSGAVELLSAFVSGATSREGLRTECVRAGPRAP